MAHTCIYCRELCYCNDDRVYEETNNDGCLGCPACISAIENEPADNYYETTACKAEEITLDDLPFDPEDLPEYFRKRSAKQSLSQEPPNTDNV